MKTIIQLCLQHRVISIVVLAIFLTVTIVIFGVSKNEPKPKDIPPVSAQPSSKMDKFKNGTYKPAKEIGY